jgi:hypothetical protein
MNDRAMDSSKCFKGALDQVFSCLYQNLYSNVFRDQLIFDKLTAKIKVDPGARGKSNLNLFETNGDEKVKHGLLTPDTHGLNEGLITIT